MPDLSCWSLLSWEAAGRLGRGDQEFLMTHTVWDTCEVTRVGMSGGQ